MTYEILYKWVKNRTSYRKPYNSLGAVCKYGVLCTGSHFFCSNIKSRNFAIRDLLLYLYKYVNNNRIKNSKNNMFKNLDIIDIETDSLTSIQIINGYMKDSRAYDLEKSVNYVAADTISKTIIKLEENNSTIKFK